MDFAEALYIAELRSGIAGHYSYRRVAWEMYLALQRQHPTLASLVRIDDVTQPVDLLKRYRLSGQSVCAAHYFRVYLHQIRLTRQRNVARLPLPLW